MTIYFDMDGTIANLYGVSNWLEMLIASDPTPYAVAEPLLDMDALSDCLAALKASGYKIGIVSWLAKNSSKDYDKAVRLAKRNWLKSNVAIEFDEIHIVKYGTKKSNVVRDKNGILFDDELNNRLEWRGVAYDVHNILSTLSAL